MAFEQSEKLGTAGANSGSMRARVSLISDFQLSIGDVSVAVPHGVQRLVAFLAIAARPVSRSRVAGQLWLDVPEWRALGNLRSALWRLRRLHFPIVACLDERLALDPQVGVDLSDVSLLMSQLSAEPGEEALRRLPLLVAAGDLLSDWEDDWITVERERFRELRLHALERASEVLLARGNYSAAAEAAMAAINAEPFRDSARRLLVMAYLHEGNRAAAIRTYYAFRQLMLAELGVEPSEAMVTLVQGLVRDPAAG